jgi:hypothetical protein
MRFRWSDRRLKLDEVTAIVWRLFHRRRHRPLVSLAAPWLPPPTHEAYGEAFAEGTPPH